MDALERGQLLQATHQWSPASRASQKSSLWWALSAVLLGLAGWMAVQGMAPAHGPQATELQAVVRDVVRRPDAVMHAGRPTGTTSQSQFAVHPMPLSADAQAPSLSAQGRAPFSTQSLSVIGGGLAAMVTIVVGLALHLRQRTSNDIAMAPFLGMVQNTSTPPLDKGVDVTAGESDRQTEQHRIDQRVVFNNERWRKHRSGSRFSRALGTMPQSYVIRHIVNPVIIISLCTAALCGAQLYFGSDVFNLPTSLFSLSAPSLGLLLVFRTNASYERWDGARKMIGLVKNRSEDMTRQISVRFPADRPELKKQFLRYLQSFFFALKVHLRGGPGGFEDDNNLIEDLTPILKPQELQLLLQAQNRPGHIMCCMTQIAKEAGLDGAALFCFDQNLTTLEDVLGGCERILRTPIPLSYTRMTTRFLFVWLLLLPLALSGEILKLDHDIWLTIPAVAFIAFALLGIEEVGVQIEEPFSILPMEAYAEGSRKNTQGIFDQMSDVAQITNASKQ